MTKSLNDFQCCRIYDPWVKLVQKILITNDLNLILTLICHLLMKHLVADEELEFMNLVLSACLKCNPVCGK